MAQDSSYKPRSPVTRAQHCFRQTLVTVFPGQWLQTPSLTPFDSFYEKYRLVFGKILTPRVQSVRIYRVILWVVRFYLEVRCGFDFQVILTLGYSDCRYLSRPR